MLGFRVRLRVRVRARARARVRVRAGRGLRPHAPSPAALREEGRPQARGTAM